MTKRILITAGASGIGRAMAEAFAANGAKVWVADVDDQALQQCPKDWHRERLDVSDEAGVATLMQKISQAWGGLEVLCANAGIAGPTALVEHVQLEDWRRCIAVNLEGAFLCAKYTVPLMKAQKSGSMGADLFHCRHLWLSEPISLFCRQMGDQWSHENACHGARPLWYSCQFHLSRRRRRPTYGGRSRSRGGAQGHHTRRHLPRLRGGNLDALVHCRH